MLKVNKKDTYTWGKYQEIGFGLSIKKQENKPSFLCFFLPKRIRCDDDYGMDMQIKKLMICFNVSDNFST